jgi:hypothetical protein
MPFLDDEPEVQIGPTIDTIMKPKEEVVKQMTANERTIRAAEALKDATEAYKLEGVPAQSDDIRSLAITFMIDEGKNNRTPPRTPSDLPLGLQQAILHPVRQPVAQQPQQTIQQTVAVVQHKCQYCGEILKKGKKFKPTSPDYYCPCGCKAWEKDGVLSQKKYN